MRAPLIVASILARDRTISAFSSRRAISRSPIRATVFGSKPRKALRKASRLRRMVSHDRPAWKPSSMSFSHSARPSYSGTPHSSSWYLRISGLFSAQEQRWIVPFVLVIFVSLRSESIRLKERLQPRAQQTACRADQLKRVRAIGEVACIDLGCTKIFKRVEGSKLGCNLRWGKE